MTPFTTQKYRTIINSSIFISNQISPQWLRNNNSMSLSSPGLKLSLSVSISVLVETKPARLSGAKEGRFTPLNEPPLGTGNQAIDEAVDNYKASPPPEQLCVPQTSSENARQDHTPA